jgi:bifunctional DNA-binding transcriptional regulator/antitoxin component of YhaV-PrlF toxin-antitoxin module
VKANEMPEIRMRPKHQITLPASVVRAANLKEDDRLNVDYLNGVIVITQKKSDNKNKSDVMAYAGIGKGLWGDTPDEIDATIRTLRDSWES